MTRWICADNLPYEKVGKNEPVCIADEVPFEIPDSWEWVRLSTANEMYTGNSINENEKKQKYMGLIDGYCYIGTKDVGFDHTINYDNGVKVPYSNEKFRIAPRNSILLCIEGGSAGRKISFTNKDICFGNKLCCFISYGIDYKFLYYYLQSPLFQSAFKENTTGIIGGVSVNTLKSMFLPIPPIEEQRRIVQEILKLEPYIKEYRVSEETIAKLNSTFPEQLKKSILQEAVQGKLVPQDPNDEPASVLLERIRAEKQRLISEGKIKKDKHESIIFRRDNSHYEKLDGIERCIDDEIPFEIPNTWEWVRFFSVVNIATNLVRPEIHTDYMHIAPDNIEKATGTLLECHTVQQDKVVSPNHLFYKGQIIYSKIRPLLRKAVIAPFDGLCSADMYPLNTSVNKEYLLRYILSDTFNLQVATAMSSRVKMPKINQNELSKILIPIPPMQEQERIVSKIDELFNKITLI